MARPRRKTAIASPTGRPRPTQVDADRLNTRLLGTTTEAERGFSRVLSGAGYGTEHGALTLRICAARVLALGAVPRIRGGSLVIRSEQLMHQETMASTGEMPEADAQPFATLDLALSSVDGKRQRAPSLLRGTAQLLDAIALDRMFGESLRRRDFCLQLVDQDPPDRPIAVWSLPMVDEKLEVVWRYRENEPDVPRSPGSLALPLAPASVIRSVVLRWPVFLYYAQLWGNVKV